MKPVEFKKKAILVFGKPETNSLEQYSIRSFFFKLIVPKNSYKEITEITKYCFLELSMTELKEFNAFYTSL